MCFTTISGSCCYLFFIKRKKLQFDIAHAVNFHSDSVPTFLWMLGKPTMWGPVGHHPKVAKQFVLPVYGKAAYLKDRCYFTFKWMLRNLDPFFRLAVKKTDKIFVINSSVVKAMKVEESKVVIVPAVATEAPELSANKTQNGFKVLSVGRFHYMKGFDLTIATFAKFHASLDQEAKEKSELILVGNGEEKKRLKKIASSLEIDHKIRWVAWVDRAEMKELYNEASVFLFPSHEGAGMVVPEAMSYGLPVVTLDNVGPGELVGNAGLKVVAGKYDSTISLLAEKLVLLERKQEIYEQYAKLSRAHYRAEFTWESKGTKIKAAYENNQKAAAIFHPSSELYGADRILVNAINAMPDEVQKIVYLKFQGPLEAYVKEHTKNTTVKVIPFMPVIYRGIFNPKGIVKFTMEWFRFNQFLKQENRQHVFFSAYVNTLSTTFLLPILKALKIPSYLHVHEIIDSPKAVGWLTAQLSKWFAQKIVCVSAAVENGLNRYSKRIRQKIVVIHNGIDQVLAKPKAPGSNLNFYLFGRIMPKKGQWYLLEALKQLPVEKLRNVQFTLMGGAVPGKEDALEALKQEIKSAGLEKVVTIKNFAPNITGAMEDADVCLVPSMMKDPFPTTVLEAMSAGRPVIATNHGGAKEALSGSKGGFLVEPGKPDALASCILQMIKRKTIIPTMGDNAQKRYLSSFTLAHFNHNWSAFLSNNNFA